MVLHRLAPDVIDEDNRWWGVWTLVAGVTLGLSGAALSAVLMRAFTSLLSTFGIELSLPTLLVLALVIGQYVAFGGLAVAYLRFRGLSVGSVGLRTPSLREFAI
ncbi:hypothetical protein ACFQE1_19770, partial [Halobium palmae]